MINLNFKNVQIYFPHSGNGGTIVNLKLTIPEKKNQKKKQNFDKTFFCMKHVHVYIGFGKCIQGIIEQLCLFCTSIRLNNINQRKNKLIYVKQLVEI